MSMIIPRDGKGIYQIFGRTKNHTIYSDVISLFLTGTHLFDRVLPEYETADIVRHRNPQSELIISFG